MICSRPPPPPLSPGCLPAPPPPRPRARPGLARPTDSDVLLSTRMSDSRLGCSAGAPVRRRRRRPTERPAPAADGRARLGWLTRIAAARASGRPPRVSASSESVRDRRPPARCPLLCEISICLSVCLSVCLSIYVCIYNITRSPCRSSRPSLSPSCPS